MYCTKKIKETKIGKYYYFYPLNRVNGDYRLHVKFDVLDLILEAKLL